MSAARAIFLAALTCNLACDILQDVLERCEQSALCGGVADVPEGAGLGQYSRPVFDAWHTAATSSTTSRPELLRRHDRILPPALRFYRPFREGGDEVVAFSGPLFSRVVLDRMTLCANRHYNTPGRTDRSSADSGR
jgi:hypothetical protein